MASYLFFTHRAGISLNLEGNKKINCSLVILKNRSRKKFRKDNHPNLLGGGSNPPFPAKNKIKKYATGPVNQSYFFVNVLYQSPLEIGQSSAHLKKTSAIFSNK